MPLGMLADEASKQALSGGPVRASNDLQSLVSDLEFLAEENSRRLEHIKSVLFGSVSEAEDGSDRPSQDPSISATIRRIETLLRDHRDLLSKLQDSLTTSN